MSLVLTELSLAGIAMAADSAISIMNTRTGEITEVDQIQWRKLIKVPRIGAAVSYWGNIGEVHPGRFDEWLERLVETMPFGNLPEFASNLSGALNTACHNRPLPARSPVGLHVAGIHEWEDGTRRPQFFHVHNGHLHTEATVVTNSSTQTSAFPTQSFQFPSGEAFPSSSRSFLQTLQNDNVSLRFQTVSQRRELFQVHRDFPRSNLTLDQNLEALEAGVLTRNGAYGPYLIIAGALDMIRRSLNTIDGISIPRDPESIGSRVGFLALVLDTVINTYRCSTLERIIGGKKTLIGIRFDGSYFDDEDYRRSTCAV